MKALEHDHGDGAAPLRSAQSREDPECLRIALDPDARSTILSTDAVGDSAFALLLQGAGRVVSIHETLSQFALVELKRAAVVTLEHDELLRFVGVSAGSDRGALYARLRHELPAPARTYWDARPLVVARGLIHTGTIEDAWRAFRTRVHPLLHTRRTIQAAFEPRTRLGREEFWHERWNNRRWEHALRRLRTERVVELLGGDVATAGRARVDAARHFAGRAFHAFVDLDPTTNPFLQYMLLGRFLDLEAGPAWLSPSSHALLRARLERLEVHCVELERHLSEQETDTYTGCNLSNTLEWASDDRHERVYVQVVRASVPGATIVSWSDLVLRGAPETLVERGIVSRDHALSERLHDMDRAFLHRGYHVDHVLHPQLVR